MAFTPSPAELELVNQIFAKADAQKIDVLTGQAALKIFGGAKLSPIVWGQILNILDEGNNTNRLSRNSVAIAVRLIGWAQKGEKMAATLVNRRECHICNCVFCFPFPRVLLCKPDLCLRLKVFKCLYRNRTRGSRLPSLHCPHYRY